MRAVARDAFTGCAREGRFRPGADAGLRVGRDVGRIDHAKRGCHCVAAGERLPAFGRVARRAIATARKRLALRDQLRREASRCRRGDWSNGRLPRQHAKAYEPEASESDGGNEQLPEHGVLRRLTMARIVQLVTSWAAAAA